MSNTLSINGRPIGDGHPVFIIAEIGINHNGDLDVATRLIDAAMLSGCDAVKFQKRTPELCVPPEQRDVIRETPWGMMTYLDYRRRVEFDRLVDGHLLGESQTDHGGLGGIRDEGVDPLLGPGPQAPLRQTAGLLPARVIVAQHPDTLAAGTLVHDHQVRVNLVEHEDRVGWGVFDDFRQGRQGRSDADAGEVGHRHGQRHRRGVLQDQLTPEGVIGQPRPHQQEGFARCPAPQRHAPARDHTVGVVQGAIVPPAVFSLDPDLAAQVAAEQALALPVAQALQVGRFAVADHALTTLISCAPAATSPVGPRQTLPHTASSQSSTSSSFRI